eukprot:CAMPEP_0183721908 /NCGR_PEP_ID=MMETSP0737-20130205/14023_1 /TAXON_ID=385413 /ORGANISM="Thalassiosira miniscula, Strain CCMP1093" /LENGTH=243 /DNA_ID=CAMNT_0025951973 /DNA_START=47 /DNA_END=778 /DNA_ORIENTATION=+
MTSANETCKASSKRCASASGSNPRPYNHYNLYFILERELFLQSRGVASATNSQRPKDVGFHDEYGSIGLPPLPSRYSSLVLPRDWFVHKKKKRAHVKTHGLVSFSDMAAMVASRWKQESQEIVLYVKTVAQKVKQRHDELKKTRPNNTSTSSGDMADREAKNLNVSGVVRKLRTEIQAQFQKDVTVIKTAVKEMQANHPGPETCLSHPNACIFISKSSRSSSPIRELDMPDHEIIAIWCSSGM